MQDFFQIFPLNTALSPPQLFYFLVKMSRFGTSICSFSLKISNNFKFRKCYDSFLTGPGIWVLKHKIANHYFIGSQGQAGASKITDSLDMSKKTGTPTSPKANTTESPAGPRKDRPAGKPKITKKKNTKGKKKWW